MERRNLIRHRTQTTQRRQHYGVSAYPENITPNTPKKQSHMKPNSKKRITLLFVIILAASAIALTGCNLTRTVTTQSQYYQRGDTAVVIQTKTTETYDATKK